MVPGRVPDIGNGNGSSNLFKTPVPPSRKPREWYLQNSKNLPPPWIGYSRFVPPAMVTHLMRGKKDSAIAKKFVANNSKLDIITNIEGALHTFVTPIVDVTIHGDYQWKNGHSICRLGEKDGYQLGRRVLLSALIQQDFENREVMMRVASLEDQEIIGSPHLPEMLDPRSKQDEWQRVQYDRRLRNYLVWHLVASQKLPPMVVVQAHAMGTHGTLGFLRDQIEQCPGPKLPGIMQGRFFRHEELILSLEILFQTALQQIRNEFLLLEEICGKQGYVYTFNPPAIFVRALGADGGEVISRIHVAALKHFVSTVKLSACRCIAWNDFSSKSIMSLLGRALAAQPSIAVRRNSDIFLPQKSGNYHGLYLPPKGTEDAILVIHNNSDAFGQNIETESDGGSLDGVIGNHSSAAGSLKRDRQDLCSRLAPF